MSDEYTAAGSHVSYEDVAAARRGSAEYREGYSEAERTFRIGLAVRERRLALGLSQVELAARAKMTQPALSRLEAGGVLPTIPPAGADLRRPRRRAHRRDLTPRCLSQHDGPVSDRDPDTRSERIPASGCAA
ncbi:MAG: helix-turn-helix domain-containing protein [Streptosporangiaceae bacterium]